MPTYQPGVYAFDIVFSDPNGEAEGLRIRSNVTVTRAMTDQEIAQLIRDTAAADLPNAPVLRLPRPTYHLKLGRRR